MFSFVCASRWLTSLCHLVTFLKRLPHSYRRENNIFCLFTLSGWQKYDRHVSTLTPSALPLKLNTTHLDYFRRSLIYFPDWGMTWNVCIIKIATSQKVSETPNVSKIFHAPWNTWVWLIVIYLVNLFCKFVKCSDNVEIHWSNLLENITYFPF